MANFPEVDSAGTPLPTARLLGPDDNISDAIRMGTISAFLGAVAASMANGYKVFYDPETKRAEIVHPDGGISQIQHS